jgi:hypothetical protein
MRNDVRADDTPLTKPSMEERRRGTRRRSRAGRSRTQRRRPTGGRGRRLEPRRATNPTSARVVPMQRGESGPVYVSGYRHIRGVVGGGRR